MGFYIDPDGMSKEQWIMEHAVGGQTEPPAIHRQGDYVWVCLVNNGGFTAAAICFDERERDRFARPDGRPKLWALVPIEDVQQFLHGRKVEQ